MERLIGYANKCKQSATRLGSQEGNSMARVRDRREANWFWMNKAVLDTYGPRIGANGIAIYAFLARCANEQGHAIPSIRFIARHVALSTNTVMKYIDLLAEVGLIEAKTRRDKAGDMTSTEYVLLTPSEDDLETGVSTTETPKWGVSTTETPLPLGVSQPVRQVSQPLQDRVSTSETFQEPLNKKEKNKDLPPLSPKGETRINMKRVLVGMPEDPEDQSRLQANILDEAFEVWRSERYPQAPALPQWEHFVNQCLSRSYRYADFRRAFMNSFTWENSPAQRTLRVHPAERAAQRQSDLHAWAAAKHAQKEAHNA
jgi:DNA-binding transcriptional MocR family regulator